MIRDPDDLDDLLEVIQELHVELSAHEAWSQILADLHPKQRAFVEDPAPRKCALKGRRGGGSWGSCAWLAQNWQSWPGVMSLFIAGTKEHAKAILWPTLEFMDRKYKWGVRYNHLDLIATFPNGYCISLRGAKDRVQVEKLRGFASGLRRVVIDECFTATTPVQPIGEVQRVIARPAPSTLVTVDGVTSTPDHPYLTPDGWKRAADLRPGDLLFVWEATATEKATASPAAHVLQGLSLPLSGPKAARQHYYHCAAADACKSHRPTSGGDPGATRRVQAQGVGDLETNRASASRARRQRPWAYVAGVDARESHWLGAPLRRAHRWEKERGTPHPLQVGPSSPIAEARCGGGWQQSLPTEPQSTGPQEGSVAAWRRVDRVEVHERGGIGRYRDVCPDGLVYNLQTQSGLYFAGGRLVHNCGSFAAHDGLFRYMLQSVLAPQLMDHRHKGGGQMALISSPGIDPIGFFFEKTEGRDHMGKEVPTWSTHHWTALDNPYLDAKAYLIEELASGGHMLDDTPAEVMVEELLSLKDVPQSDPRWDGIRHRLSATFRREYLAHWVKDNSALVYLVTPENILREGFQLPAGQYRITVGCDIGWGDGNGFTVAAKPAFGREVYLLESYYRPELSTAEIATELREIGQRWHTSELYVDTGGEGERLVVDLLNYGVVARAAGKGRKKPRIEYMRSLLDTGHLKVRPETCGELLTEWSALVWDDTRQLHREGFVDDVSDSALMAVNPLSQLYVPPKGLPPAPGTAAHREAQDRRELEQAIRAGKRIARKQRPAHHRRLW
jgi:hypothetical protein